MLKIGIFCYIICGRPPLYDFQGNGTGNLRLVSIMMLESRHIMVTTKAFACKMSWHWCLRTKFGDFSDWWIFLHTYRILVFLDFLLSRFIRVLLQEVFSVSGVSLAGVIIILFSKVWHNFWVMSSQKNVRLQRELALFTDSPPHGISCWIKEDSLQHLEARKFRKN